LVVAAAGCASAPRNEIPLSAMGSDGPVADGAAPAGAAEIPSAKSTSPDLEKALGLFPRNSGPFDDFARPITNLDFHHPFIWNEIRPVYAYHWLPDHGLLDGGSLKVYACQINVALTDKLGITAYKDGYVHLDSNALPGDRGFADLAGGLKYKVYENLDAMYVATLGVGYEDYHMGDAEVLEGQGHGIFDPFVSVAKEWCGFHWIATVGAKLPRHSYEDNRAIHWHLHTDFEAFKDVNAVFELNGMHYMESARRNAGLGVPLGIEGFDYTNLGSEGVDGNDVITWGVGFRWKLDKDISVGAAFERPLSDHKDVFQQRVTLDVTYRF
jgi:hypothetical protein